MCNVSGVGAGGWRALLCYLGAWEGIRYQVAAGFASVFLLGPFMEGPHAALLDFKILEYEKCSCHPVEMAMSKGTIIQISK